MKITGSCEKVHLFMNQGPILRIENDEIKKAVKKFYNFKAEKFDGLNLNIKKDDLYPTEDDYYLFAFRLISATILGSGSYKSSDFRDAKLLKKSVPLLANKPAYVNHDLYVGNEIGTIGETQWSNGYKAQDGTEVPPGIDGPYVIDSKLHPELCRKLNAPIPSIQSSSVTVVFDWESSHDFEHDYDFFRHVGEMIDGREVTRVVTAIHDYIESSLVYLGADPYAKKKDASGNLINIDKYSIMSNSKEDSNPLFKLCKEQGELYIIENFAKENSLPLRKAILNNYKNDEDPMFTEVQKFIAQTLGVKPEEVTQDLMKGYSFVKSDELSVLKANADKITPLETENTQLKAEKDSLSAEKTTLTEKVTTLEADKTVMEAQANFGKEVLETKKKECIEAYKKSTKGKFEQVIVDEINATADSKSLDAKLKMFGKTLVEEFGAHCDKCGSGDNISYRSSQHEGGEDDKNKENKPNGMFSEFIV